MSVFILGDIHGSFLAINTWLKNYATPGDILIQVGDFGAGFLHPKRVESLGRKFDDIGCRLLAIRGNHDDPLWFNENRKFGGIEFLSDCTRTIEGRSFLFLGGAVSVDRLYRTEKLDWWANERYNFNEEFLKSVSGVECVVSHTCPGSAIPATILNGQAIKRFIEKDPNLREDLNEEQNQMELSYNILKENNKISKWYFGHFHVSETTFIGDTVFRCLNIDEFYHDRETSYII